MAGVALFLLIILGVILFFYQVAWIAVLMVLLGLLFIWFSWHLLRGRPVADEHTGFDRVPEDATDWIIRFGQSLFTLGMGGGLAWWGLTILAG
jgi:hypothetical protein